MSIKDEKKMKKMLLGAIVIEIRFWYKDDVNSIILEKNGKKYKIESDRFSRRNYLEIEELEK